MAYFQTLTDGLSDVNVTHVFNFSCAILRKLILVLILLSIVVLVTDYDSVFLVTVFFEYLGELLLELFLLILLLNLCFGHSSGVEG